MRKAATAMILLVAVEHLYFLVLEMFLWTTPTGLKTFNNTQEHADASATLAANQGLYNGFLAAGLVWAALSKAPLHLRYFFLGCVIVAGTYGGITVGPKLFFVQAVPAIIALGLVVATRKSN